MPRRRPNAAAAPRRELRARGQRTMQRLLDAGVEVFAARGYHAARVDDIVKVAETSHGTFYLYFANKEELFRALAENVATEMRALADSLPPITADAAGTKALRTWLESFADHYVHYVPLFRAWTEAETWTSEFGRLGTNVLAEFTRSLIDRVRTAAPADLDPVVTSIALVAMIERCNYYVLSQQVQITRDAMIETLAAVTHAALFGSRVKARSRA